MNDDIGKLSDRMRTLARQRPDIRQEFTALADELDRVCDVASPSIPKLVGTWAKARRRYCEETGEPLV